MLEVSELRANKTTLRQEMQKRIFSAYMKAYFIMYFSLSVNCDPCYPMVYTGMQVVETSSKSVADPRTYFETINLEDWFTTLEKACQQSGQWDKLVKEAQLNQLISIEEDKRKELLLLLKTTGLNKQYMDKLGVGSKGITANISSARSTPNGITRLYNHADYKSQLLVPQDLMHAIEDVTHGYVVICVISSCLLTVIIV